MFSVVKFPKLFLVKSSFNTVLKKKSQKLSKEKCVRSYTNGGG